MAEVEDATGTHRPSISYQPTRFAKVHGITQDQARRLIKKLGKNEVKLIAAVAKLRKPLGL